MFCPKGGNKSGVPIIAIAIIIMLLVVFMPSFAKIRNLSYRLICSTNMDRLGKAMMVYATEYNDMYPTSSKWCDLLVEKVKVTPMLFKCKGTSNDGCTHYAMNKNIEKLGKAASANMVLVFETGPGWNQCGGQEMLTADNHQGEGCNILFADGHVEFVTTQDLPNLKWATDVNK